MPKTITIDGVVGWEILAKDIKKQIDEASDEEIVFEFLNVPGGSVFEGLAVFNLIKNIPQKTTSHIMSLAGSMSSIIPLAADEVVVEPNAVFFIHNVLIYTVGNHIELRKTADLIENLSKLLARTYIAKTGKPVSEISQLMDEETFFFGQEIVDFGFADRMVDSEVETDKGESVAYAKISIDDCQEKLRERPENQDQIAAILNVKNQASEPVQKSVQRSSAKSENKKEDKHMDPKTMTLDEFLAQNANAKVDHDQRLKDAAAEGKTAGIEAKQADIDRVLPLISAEGTSKALVESGFKALAKDGDINSFVAIADYETRVKADAEAKAADEEAEDLEETPAGVSKKSENGKIANSEDLEAEKALFNKMKGKKEGDR